MALHHTGETDAESLFVDLDQARQLISAWATDYNTARPHSSLGYKTLAAYAGTFIILACMNVCFWLTFDFARSTSASSGNADVLDWCFNVGKWS